jgi:hypothetical protein
MSLNCPFSLSALVGWKVLTVKAAPRAPWSRRQANQFQAALEEPVQQYDYYARHLA